MIWTKTKPTVPGHYWLKMQYEKEGEPYSNQPPRVVKVVREDDGTEWDGKPDWDGTSLMCLESPDYKLESGLFVNDMSSLFFWSDMSITLPSDVGSCDCHLYGNAACSSCDATMPPPIQAP